MPDTTQRPESIIPAPPVLSLVRPGDDMTAAGQNDIIRALTAAAPLFEAPKQIEDSDKPPKLRTFEVIQIGGDSLLCREFSNGRADDSSSIIEVARPFGLRRGETNGKTLRTLNFGTISYRWTDLQTRIGTRQADDNFDAVTETQQITPNYESAFENGRRVRTGSIIVAATSVIGGTSLYQTVVGQDSQQPVPWIDTNNAGRAWAEVVE